MSILRVGSSGPFLKRYQAVFSPQTIVANDSVSNTVDAPGVEVGQNIVANGDPLNTANLVIQAVCRTAGIITVYLTNSTSSNIALSEEQLVNLTPI